ncbi:hypothetical protein [Iningainema tapete]|uniref:Uncharacterized protein n=1 Tax=Iningainema tapete BLCC-T55 TaxID=2748662 RepID=A0A8J6XJZ2_9CYAN|nr:hypothetical protein [Iningainema tapete]MBD2773951.1 hypothetical protein [Iningainema tapete BLCC-T55]
MKSDNFISSPVGETTDVEVWLFRAGLRFEDLGSDDASTAIRMQWREYQAAVQKCCAILRLPPERVQLCGVYTRLRIPDRSRREKCAF